MIFVVHRHRPRDLLLLHCHSEDRVAVRFSSSISFSISIFTLIDLIPRQYCATMHNRRGYDGWVEAFMHDVKESANPCGFSADQLQLLAAVKAKHRVAENRREDPG